MKKGKTIIIIGLVALVGTSSFLYYSKNKVAEKDKTMAVYVEGDGGEYTSYNSKKFPTDGYVLNTEKSYCVNGSVLSQDETTKSISVSVSRSDQCNLYFDTESYTLTINPNGGTYNGSASNSILSLKMGTSTTLSTPTKTGYNFSYWSNTGGTLSGSKFTMGVGNATVTANYSAQTYTITFNPNGGTVDTTSKTVTFENTYGDLPTPTYDGYTFNGWFTSTSGGTQITSTSTVTITSNQTLYAQWEQSLITFTIDNTTYYAEDGMTWDEWINSAYNYNDFSFDSCNNFIITGAGSKYYWLFDVSNETGPSSTSYSSDRTSKVSIPACIA